MTFFINPAHVVWSEFQGLETAQPEWLMQRDYWEEYSRAFFQSNGLNYSARDSNVLNWLSADDRAPFACMADALLADLERHVDLSNIEFVLLAHWLPDLHLGTSVTNFVMHRLKLDDCFGFAISDHGLSAPFFALDCMGRYLRNGRTRGLLLIMDQKHLLYRSEIVDRLQPANSACIISVDTANTSGLAFKGYRRTGTAGRSLPIALGELRRDFALDDKNLTLIADQALLDTLAPALDAGIGQVATDPRLLCTAPFARMLDLARTQGDYLLLSQGEFDLSAAVFRHEGT